MVPQSEAQLTTADTHMHTYTQHNVIRHTHMQALYNHVREMKEERKKEERKKEERKKEASKVKQITMQSNTAHPSMHTHVGIIMYRLQWSEVYIQASMES